MNSISKPDLVVIEDSNAGYQFFSNFFSQHGVPCVSAQGKSNIYRELLQRSYSIVLVIADGAAFGPEVERILPLNKLRDKKLIIYLPESFEWMILKSGLLKQGHLQAILERPYDYIESEKFSSLERFFTSLLVDVTSGTYLQYNKASLNRAYMDPKEQATIVSTMPEMLF